MAMMHVRVVSPSESTTEVLAAFGDIRGTTNLMLLPGVAREPAGDLVQADVARECVPDLLDRLRDLAIPRHGSISLEVVDTGIGDSVVRAEQDAPGEAADAVIWDELVGRTGEDSTLTWSFLAFMVLATVLAAVGVVTDSPVTVVGAMVVGPEFGPLAGIAVGLLRRRMGVVRQATLALSTGFAAGVVAAALATLLWRAVGLVHGSDLAGHRQTEFIYHPGWFSIITALVAGAAGMLSLTSNRSAALVGVFISVTTVPAAGFAAVGLVLGYYHDALASLGQLAINLVGIVAAAYAVLVVQAGGVGRRRVRT